MRLVQAKGFVRCAPVWTPALVGVANCSSHVVERLQDRGLARRIWTEDAYYRANSCACGSRDHHRRVIGCIHPRRNHKREFAEIPERPEVRHRETDEQGLYLGMGEVRLFQGYSRADPASRPLKRGCAGNVDSIAPCTGRAPCGHDGPGISAFGALRVAARLTPSPWITLLRRVTHMPTASTATKCSARCSSASNFQRHWPNRLGLEGVQTDPADI
jgi:hypothetical protein